MDRKTREHIRAVLHDKRRGEELLGKTDRSGGASEKMREIMDGTA
jgi:hypothetical protein